MKGKFITIEGCEGAGKSTQTKLLKEYFEKKCLSVFFTREPGGTTISEEIRNIILNKKNSKMDAITELMLYAASRRQLTTEVIKEKLEDGLIVVCDRYVDSTTAYQGFGRGLDLEIINNLNNWAMGDIKIDLTIFLDVPPNDGFSRKRNIGSYDRLELEKESFHNNVYAGYKWLMEKEPNRIFRINGKNSKDIVFEDILNLISSKGIIQK